VTLRLVHGPYDHLLLVMYWTTDEWTIVSPTASFDVERLSDVPAVDGAIQIDLAAGPEVGRQRMVVVAVPDFLSVDWGEKDPWVGVKIVL
jgi:hypothetical protein